MYLGHKDTCRMVSVINNQKFYLDKIDKKSVDLNKYIFYQGVVENKSFIELNHTDQIYDSIDLWYSGKTHLDLDAEGKGGTQRQPIIKYPENDEKIIDINFNFNLDSQSQYFFMEKSISITPYVKPDRLSIKEKSISITPYVKPELLSIKIIIKKCEEENDDDDLELNFTKADKDGEIFITFLFSSSNKLFSYEFTNKKKDIFEKKNGNESDIKKKLNNDIVLKFIVKQLVTQFIVYCNISNIKSKILNLFSM